MSVGKVDMGETFLGTIWGDVAERHFFCIPLLLLFLFSPWESCFFFVVWGGCFGCLLVLEVDFSWFQIRKSGSNDACPTATSCLDLGVLVGAFVALVEAPWKPKQWGFG